MPTETAVGLPPKDSRYHQAVAELVERLRVRDEEHEQALRREAAICELLQVINRSGGDPAPVFDTILEKAHSLCGAAHGSLELYDGGRFCAVASRNVPTELLRQLHEGFTPGPSHPLQKLLAGEDHVQVHDAAAIDDPVARLVVQSGHRTVLSVALRKEGRLLGRIVASRTEVRPFVDRDIALLQSFAAQAVIAMENARLLDELRGRTGELQEALDYQTAIREVIQVISRSTFDLAPVLQTLAETALRLCEADLGFVCRREGDVYRVVTAAGSTPESASNARAYQQYQQHHLLAADRSSLTGRVALEKRPVQIADVTLDPDYRLAQAPALGGIRTQVGVPLMREGVLIGVIIVSRQRVSPFSGRQVDLLQVFADQAVIAIENTRLLTEQREALEQQTATAEVLRVISQSPTDVAPVLIAVVGAARRFCGADDAMIVLRKGQEQLLSTHEGSMPALVGTTIPLDSSSTTGRACIEGRTVHVPDVAALDATEDAMTIELARRTNVRALLAAPMMRDGTAIGSVLLRKPEPIPFTPRQVALLETFAAQAVIAIENVRLFTELRESLEQQTAMAEILRAISQSPTDVQPVLDAVVQAGIRFCGAQDALIVMRQGNEFVFSAHAGPLGGAPGQRSQLTRGSVLGRVLLTGRTIHLPDISAVDPDDYPDTLVGARMFGYRALVGAPMLREGGAFGVLMLRKSEPGTFADRQIELLETFAAQAVIAIENVRLFTELRESLERLKAAQANLIQAEKMASLGQLTAGIAHEIKNPLNFVNNFAGLSGELVEELRQGVEAVLAERDGDKRAELQETMDLLTGNLAKIVEHGRRADGIVKSMLAHSRGGTGDWQSSNINGLIEEALNLAYHGARAQDQGFNVTLERAFGADLKPIDVVPQDITRVFLNLFGNGFYAIRQRQRDNGANDYRPTLLVSTRELGEAVEVRVRDNGIGIAPEARDKLFQPFFTTKPTGEGTGLGLSISYDIVTQQHGGSIEVESEVGRFTEFTVRLPRARRAVSGG